ncbi:prenyltransferase/squalene oxidase repeat-containing protein [Amycolatopsis aidingensis]|uniref:hypothetical protein n=1 Tax=Amycolatopsis aidingensis TaxID=2842453 RepID=UPI001C0DFEB3|nr:hypothetical protein [Amycolatopsis aidingensis]
MTPELDATADTIAATQRPDGAIPADHRSELDPWNHIEAAMGLDTAGRHDAAARAYRWLAHRQNPDGSWYARYHHGRPVDLARDSNFTAYLAVGAHHHYRTTRDTTFLTDLWPTIDHAITFTLSLRRTDGSIAWRRHPDGTTTNLALLTGNSSIHHALRCAHALATHLGHDRPHWTEAAGRLRTAIRSGTGRFAPKPHAMDWYYPVLGGALEPPPHTTTSNTSGTASSTQPTASAACTTNPGPPRPKPPNSPSPSPPSTNTTAPTNSCTPSNDYATTTAPTGPATTTPPAPTGHPNAPPGPPQPSSSPTPP